MRWNTVKVFHLWVCVQHWVRTLCLKLRRQMPLFLLKWLISLWGKFFSHSLPSSRSNLLFKAAAPAPGPPAILKPHVRHICSQDAFFLRLAGFMAIVDNILWLCWSKLWALECDSPSYLINLTDLLLLNLILLTLTLSIVIPLNAIISVEDDGYSSLNVMFWLGL